MEGEPNQQSEQGTQQIEGEQKASLADDLAGAAVQAAEGDHALSNVQSQRYVTMQDMKRFTDGAGNAYIALAKKVEDLESEVATLRANSGTSDGTLKAKLAEHGIVVPE